MIIVQDYDFKGIIFVGTTHNEMESLLKSLFDNYEEGFPINFVNNCCFIQLFSILQML